MVQTTTGGFTQQEGSYQVRASEIPTLVKVISIWNYILAALLILGGVLMFLGGGLIASLLLSFAGVFGALVILAAIIIVGIGIFRIFVGVGLWKGRNWARVAAIILSILAMLLDIISVVQGGLRGLGGIILILSLVINIIIGAYLSFNNTVKSAFS